VKYETLRLLFELALKLKMAKKKKHLKLLGCLLRSPRPGQVCVLLQLVLLPRAQGWGPPVPEMLPIAATLPAPKRRRRRRSAALTSTERARAAGARPRARCRCSASAGVSVTLHLNSSLESTAQTVPAKLKANDSSFQLGLGNITGGFLHCCDPHSSV